MRERRRERGGKSEERMERRLGLEKQRVEKKEEEWVRERVEGESSGALHRSMASFWWSSWSWGF